eukprot:3518431-Pyramimonas_sp.AAC.1
MRPLQLPTCLRRLHGATIADHLGPVIEPRLSPNQAAKRGGQCGPNIIRHEPPRPGPGGRHRTRTI